MTRTKPRPEDWWLPPEGEPEPEPGYAEWLAAELDAAIAEADAGKVIPAEQVWKELGLE